MTAKMQNYFSHTSNTIITLVTIAILLALGVFVLQYKQENNNAEIKSIAWYTANPKAAKIQNQICFENTQLKQTENCTNALHALEMSYKGTNT